MGSKTETSTRQTETRSPFSPAQPFIANNLNAAQNLFNSDIGTNYFPGNTSVPLSFDTSLALDAMRERALSGSPLNFAANEQLLNTIEGDFNNPANSFNENALSGQFNNGSENLFTPFLNEQSSPASSFFNDIASSSNPYLDRTFDLASRKISDQVNANFSKAGRFGSVAHQGKLTEDLSDFATDLFGGAFADNQNRRLNAARSIQDGFDNDNARRLNAARSINSIRDNNFNRRASAAQNLSNDFSTEKAQQMQAVLGAGNMAANDFNDIDRLAQVGQVNEAQSLRDLQAQIDKFNFFEQMPFNRLAQNAQLSFGFGGLGSTTQLNGNVVKNTSGLSPALGSLGSLYGQIFN